MTSGLAMFETFAPAAQIKLRRLGPGVYQMRHGHRCDVVLIERRWQDLCKPRGWWRVIKPGENPYWSKYWRTLAEAKADAQAYFLGDD